MYFTIFQQPFCICFVLLLHNVSYRLKTNEMDLPPQKCFYNISVNIILLSCPVPIQHSLIYNQQSLFMFILSYFNCFIRLVLFLAAFTINECICAVTYIILTTFILGFNTFEQQCFSAKFDNVAKIEYYLKMGRG